MVGCGSQMSAGRSRWNRDPNRSNGFGEQAEDHSLPLFIFRTSNHITRFYAECSNPPSFPVEVQHELHINRIILCGCCVDENTVDSGIKIWAQKKRHKFCSYNALRNSPSIPIYVGRTYNLAVNPDVHRDSLYQQADTF